MWVVVGAGGGDGSRDGEDEGGVGEVEGGDGEDDGGDGEDDSGHGEDIGRDDGSEGGNGVWGQRAVEVDGKTVRMG